MKAIDYLYNELESISKSFPNVHIKCGYNSIIRTHIVELLPVTEFRFNSALDEAWIPLSFQFRETFPKEEIAFISSDSKLSIEGSIFEFNAPSLEDVLSEVFAQLSEDELNYTFPTSIPNDAIAIENSVVRLLSYPTKSINEEEFENDTLYLVAA